MKMLRQLTYSSYSDHLTVATYQRYGFLDANPMHRRRRRCPIWGRPRGISCVRPRGSVGSHSRPESLPCLVCNQQPFVGHVLLEMGRCSEPSFRTTHYLEIRTTMLRPRRCAELPSIFISSPASTISRGEGSAVSTTCHQFLPMSGGSSKSRSSQYIFSMA